MEQLEAAVRNLIDVLKQTQEYQSYQENVKAIRDDVEIKSKIDELRSLNYLMQNTPEGAESVENEERLEEQFERLCEDSRVNDFMQAEIDFCRMFQDIMMQITQEIDFE